MTLKNDADSMQVIDYRVQAPLHSYLSKTYGSEPFDAILDTIGTQLLFDESPAYLKPNGKFINVGAMEGLVTGIWSMAKNTLWPRLLGGTPRSYTFQQTNPVQETMQYLIKLVEEEKLIVVIDKVFQMEDALQVSSCSFDKNALFAYYFIRRHTIAFLANGQRVR
jgi:NADPH:quinone reductase-like Zn-dependent oxidoreductase